MSTNLKHELAIAECNSLRRQLKDAYNKCSAIYETLSMLDEHSTQERFSLENLISDLKQTIRNELEKNTELYIEKLEIKQKENYLRQELNIKQQDLNKIMIKHQRIYLHQQQQKYIQDNIRVRMKK